MKMLCKVRSMDFRMERSRKFCLKKTFAFLFLIILQYHQRPEPDTQGEMRFHRHYIKHKIKKNSPFPWKLVFEMSLAKNGTKEVVKSPLQWLVPRDFYLVQSRKAIKDLNWTNLSSAYNEVIFTAYDLVSREKSEEATVLWRYGGDRSFTPSATWAKHFWKAGHCTNNLLVSTSISCASQRCLSCWGWTDA